MAHPVLSKPPANIEDETRCFSTRAVAMLGFGYSKVKQIDDSMVEEAAESFIEGKLEAALGLEEDALEGAIDLTPLSKED